MDICIKEHAGRMCRLSSGRPDFGSFGAVKFDHGGVPVPCRPQMNDMWLLSDNGQGARALVVYGTLDEIAGFFGANANKGIENTSPNTFSGKPDIYMSVFELSTVARYKSLYPYNEAATRVAKFAGGTLSSPATFGAMGLKMPSSAVGSRIAASLGKLASKLHKEIPKVRNPGFAAAPAAQGSGILMVKFWHVPFGGSRKIGTGKLFFRDIDKAVLQQC